MFKELTIQRLKSGLGASIVTCYTQDNNLHDWNNCMEVGVAASFLKAEDIELKRVRLLHTPSSKATRPPTQP